MLAWVLALGHASALASDDASWQLRHEDLDTGTRVWLRERAGETPEFRATTRLRARLSALAALLLDSTHTHEWVYRTRQAIVLESDGPTRGVTLLVTAMPWPLADRETIVAWELAQDPQTLVVTMAGHDAPEKLPPHPERVRMVSFKSRWQLTPLPDGLVDVLFEGHGDPGGNLALQPLRSFANQAVWQAPWQTVNAMREIVQRPEFSQAVLPFIQEPAP